MSLVDRLAVRQPSASTYECPNYRPIPGSKRCQHYLDNGACALADELMCSEWLKANGQKPGSSAVHVEAPAPTEPPPAAAKPDDVARDLFGVPIAPPAPKRPAKRKPERVASPPPTPPAEVAPGEPIPRISDEDIASFKALGVEVCLRSDALGDVWLVPEYTERDRREITPEHAATLRLIVDAFPGAQVVAFEKLRKEAS
ncbi:MAG: hypothetical protein JXB32_18175 [Deltaproteobacteria bacterium]|nr:hypothetical protein [Deltaproteobacteria bacterium]